MHDFALSSGLPVVLVPQPSVHRAVAALLLRVGSRFESAETNGISHFLEHMLFRGSHSLESAHAQALAVIVAAQARAGRYDDLLRVVQQTWLDSTTEGAILGLAAIASPLIATHSDFGRATAAAFTWLDAQLRAS